MTSSPRATFASIVLAFAVAAARAQQAEPAQDPKLDNLVHGPDYRTAAARKLGAVVEHGEGPIDMVLVSGFGVGASAFAGFQQRNEKRYHMLAVTLPGFEGTAAPPMPAAGTSYGEHTWTRAAALAVAELIEQRKLRRPVLVGHFLNGTQVAAQVALDHPDRVRALVLLAASPHFEPAESTPSWPKGLTQQKRIAAVDQGLAPRWFKTVTRKTWEAGNFVATDYSVDEARGRQFAALANEPPLPVLVRYLCEFHASDLKSRLHDLKPPLLMIQPSFTAALRADKARSYLASFFAEPWQGTFADRPHTETLQLEDAGILVMDDKAAEVDAALAKFLERHAP